MLAGSKPRATSAYGHQSNARRAQNAGFSGERQVGTVLSGMGIQQKAMISNMHDRKMQMRAADVSQPKTNNFTGTVFNEPPHKVVGIGHGFGTQRPVSRDSRVRQQSQKNQAARSGQSLAAN